MYFQNISWQLKDLKDQKFNFNKLAFSFKKNKLIFSCGIKEKKKTEQEIELKIFKNSSNQGPDIDKSKPKV